MPGHVGIILDGNRRYARERGLADLDLTYGLGADKLDEVLAWCAQAGRGGPGVDFLRAVRAYQQHQRRFGR